MVLLREAEPGADHLAGQRPGEVLGEVGLARAAKRSTSLVAVTRIGRLEPLPDRGRIEGLAEDVAQSGVDRRIDPGEVAGGREQLVGVVVVVALAARVRRPVAGRPLDVLEARERPHVAAGMVEERSLVAEPAVAGIRDPRGA